MRAEMRPPHFVRLAEIDEHRYITACRHGLVHLTWGRTTNRLNREEFLRLVNLLEQAADGQPPVHAGQGGLQVTCRQDEDCEIRIGACVLLLSSAEFEGFVGVARKAMYHLEEVLDSGMWDQKDEESPPSVLDQLQRTSFSDN
jgi:hypothetical protein